MDAPFLSFSSHCADSSHRVKFRAVSAASDVQTLLHQFRDVMSAARPRWSGVELTFTQLRALSAIAHREPIRVSELAGELGIGLAASSSLADRMSRRQFVVRRASRDDRRIVLLSLAPRGRKLLDHIERSRNEHFTRLIQRMTPSEREALATTLEAFARLHREHTTRKEPSGLVTARRTERC